METALGIAIYALVIAIVMFMCWLFSWRIPAWIYYPTVIIGVLLLVGYIVGLGFKYAVGG